MKDPYADWGVQKVEPDSPNTDWVYNLEIYPKTPLYLNQYEMFKQVADTLGVQVTSYLSLGTGLGRHIVIAKRYFTDIKHVTAIDNMVAPHRSLINLGIEISSYRTSIKAGLQMLIENGQKFDMLVFENVGHNHEIATDVDFIHISQVLNKPAIIGIIGDTNIDSNLMASAGLFKRILNESETWGDATAHNFWLYA